LTPAADEIWVHPSTYILLDGARVVNFDRKDLHDDHAHVEAFSSETLIIVSAWEDEEYAAAIAASLASFGIYRNISISIYI
jgi:hypothetical protein